MLRNYLKIAYRNLARNKGYSFINIGGLAVGMAVAIMIGLWMEDELTFNHSNKNHDQIAQVYQSQTYNGETGTTAPIPRPLEMALRQGYANDFKHIVMATWPNQGILDYEENKLRKEGIYMQEDAPEIMDLRMLSGQKNGLKDPDAVMLSSTTAQELFGDENAVGNIVKLNNKYNLRVVGVFADIPSNSSFNSTAYIVSWENMLANSEWARSVRDLWGDSSFQMFVQIADNTTMEEVSAKIKDIKLKSDKEAAQYNPQLLLHPMDDWHLRSNFENGVKAGGQIENVWLFGTIGAFVLLLACINFINLSTARSEKRAREVGIRKSVGSVRMQLIGQFLSESFMVVCLSFLVTVPLVLALIPTFNALADKQITFPWGNICFWGVSLFFVIFTALLSGSYPALYLSSFHPVKVLKGTFRAGRYSALPRQILVVLQFTVSVALIIGTVVVFQQIQFSKNRPIGYDREGLIQTPLRGGAFNGKYDFMRQELLNTGAVVEMSSSSSPTTQVYNNRSGYTWLGKPEGFQVDLAWTAVSPEYVKSLGLKITAGRDFSRRSASDSNAVILNKTAVKYLGLKQPVGALIRSDDNPPLTIIGVIDDMIMQSPYEPVKQSMYVFDKGGNANYYNLRLNPDQSASKSIATIEGIFKKNFPDLLFEYQFVDEEYAAKFAAEERIGKLAGVFTGLAILISCLGLFGLASYVAEQRTKEIGVRKVLGASVASLWRLLSKDFVFLVLIALLIAAPLAWYFMDGWLQKYTYRTELSWWIFVAAGAGALAITLLTVSFQSVKAALMNPVESLRSE